MSEQLKRSLEGRTVTICRPEHENFPEVEAYSVAIEERGGAVEVTSRLHPRDRYDIVWALMGLHRKRPNAEFLVHDYRSLSVPPLARSKDALKRAGNARPDLRVFQNAAMQREMGFRDDVPTRLLPMGIPPWLTVESGVPPLVAAERFCYLGAMSYERRFDEFLEAFLERSVGGRMTLIGRPDGNILKKYGESPELNFVGRLPQVEALAEVRLSSFAVCYFPEHRPHLLQTPTKFLEYAALGSKILCNSHPRTAEVAAEYGIRAYFGSKYIFDTLNEEELASISDNAGLDITDLQWPTVVGKSGVLEYLTAATP